MSKEQTDEPTDDLTKPLGQDTAKKKRFAGLPFRVRTSRGIAGVLGACVAVFVGWILFVDDPSGGEPIAIVSANTAPRHRARRAEPTLAPKPDNAATAAPASRRQARRQHRHDHRRLDRQPAGSPRRAECDAAGGEHPSAEREQARRDRSIRVCSSRRAMARSRRSPPTARARPTPIRKPVKPQAGRDDLPRVAIVIEGLGIGGDVHHRNLREAARAGHVRVRAVRHRPRSLGRARARRRPRGAAAGRHGAVRLSRQRSRPADAADLELAGAERRPSALVPVALRRATSASPA